MHMVYHVHMISVVCIFKVAPKVRGVRLVANFLLVLLYGHLREKSTTDLKNEYNFSSTGAYKKKKSHQEKPQVGMEKPSFL